MSEPMKRVRRIDSVGQLAKPEKMSNGWLKLDGKIARVGIQVYEDADGTVYNELRLPEEVFSEASMKSFHMVPVTEQHPPELLNDKNTGTYQRGQVGQDVRKLDETWLGAPMMVTDADVIRKIESGVLVELSNGYSVELDPTQDEALIRKYGPYKFIQRNILGNHLALVDSARAGPEARVRLDNRGDALLGSRSDDEPPVPPERQPMKTIRIDGRDFELAEGNASAIETAVRDMLAKADQARTAAETAAQSVAAKLKIVKDNAISLIKDRKAIRAVVDAIKAKMVPCDECGGTGKVPDTSKDDAEAMKNCDMCDGDGEFRMHMPVSKATGQEEGATDDLSETLGDPDEDMDADELEVEQETEEKAGAANKSKTDKARKQRREEAVAFQAKRDASLQRRIDAGVRTRAKLEAQVRPFVGDADLSKLDSDGIKRLAIAKLSPATKTDGMKTADVGARFDALMDLAPKGAVSASDAARALTSPFFVQPRVDTNVEPKKDGSHLSGRDRMLYLQEHPESAS